ncbi:uncharacterized protein BDCG_16500 [Blastomyces dermatitidis ER-3]|uniref:NADP-dependent oxidoreductase domain-containing protein n=1 Tax=Ajellomyces dermatitidis (strain ER-3 / ATCC MYA-2586) TaxID=559297 RepID=A0ABX2VSH7_AJEDR|nr:uncharacterized protein BDCG_16500 [Blastomyces dermatitidis ER-3]OAT00173.1 hypothetical protein BDCG_16500 [Blastomyces dermatitidis ER-3]
MPLVAQNVKPRVILGLMTFGPDRDAGSRITSLDEYKKCLDYFQQQGYNETDTARIYVDGKQEAFTARAGWKERGLTLATKWYPSQPGYHHANVVKEKLDESLKELQTDCVDIFYLHAADRSVPFAETLEAVNELHKERKFVQLGLSNYTAFEVAEIVTMCNERGWVRPTIYQAMYNTITRSIETELIPACRRYGIDVVIYNPLAGGLLSGKYKSAEIPATGRFADRSLGANYRKRYFRDANFDALRIIEPVVQKHNLTLIETALRWVHHHSALNIGTDPSSRDGIIVGVSSFEQLQANLADIEKGPLPEEVVKALDEAWLVAKATATHHTSCMRSRGKCDERCMKNAQFRGRLGCDSGRDFSFLSSRTNKTVDAEKQQLKTQEKTKKNTQMPTYCDQACPSGTADSSHTSQEDTGVESGDSIAPEGNVDKRCEGSGEDSGRDPESQLADGEEYEELAKNDRGWRKIVRNFTPSWFTVNMGTGIVSILLFNLPYNGTWLYWISVGIFGLNTVLFTIFLAISILRYALWPGIWRVMLQHPVQSLFIGTFPMGFSTVVSMIALVCSPAWGSWVQIVAWALWIVDSVISVVCAVGFPFMLMASGRQSDLPSMTAAWLLPVVSTIVAASTGAIVAENLPTPQLSLWTIIASYLLWGLGMLFSMIILAVYFERLALHKLPPKSVIVSTCIPLGPMGQGGFVILKLGVGARKFFPLNKTLDPAAGGVFYAVGFMFALMLWGFGFMWMLSAIISIAKCKRIPFTMGWWASIFPLGVYANCTILMAVEMPSQFFKVVSTILTLCVLILWIIVSAGTIREVITGRVFFAPCLSDMRVKRKKKSRIKAS